MYYFWKYATAYTSSLLCSVCPTTLSLPCWKAATISLEINHFSVTASWSITRKRNLNPSITYPCNISTYIAIIAGKEEKNWWTNFPSIARIRRVPDLKGSLSPLFWNPWTRTHHPFCSDPPRLNVANGWFLATFRLFFGYIVSYESR